MMMILYLKKIKRFKLKFIYYKENCNRINKIIQSLLKNILKQRLHMS